MDYRDRNLMHRVNISHRISGRNVGTKGKNPKQGPHSPLIRPKDLTVELPVGRVSAYNRLD